MALQDTAPMLELLFIEGSGKCHDARDAVDGGYPYIQPGVFLRWLKDAAAFGHPAVSPRSAASKRAAALATQVMVQLIERGPRAEAEEVQACRVSRHLYGSGVITRGQQDETCEQRSTERCEHGNGKTLYEMR
jgi:hypothetical protein